jgi:hypothetical protein
MTRALRVFLLAGLGFGFLGCRDKKPENLAPTASALAPAAPVGDKSQTFVADAASSQVRFLMEAPIEKIFGEAPGSVDGELFVNLEDVAKSTGLVRVDLEKLSIFQQKREDEKGQFSERKKNPLQNQHARTWLEISEDTPEDVRRANRFVEFRIARLEQPSAANLHSLSGAERTLNAIAVGDFRLHGRKNEKRVKVELRFAYAGEKPQTVHVRTLEPLAIGLEEYDVRPREAFGKLAQKTLDALGSKVAKTAPIEVEFDARLK